jgi:hypothetical protein
MTQAQARRKQQDKERKRRQRSSTQVEETSDDGEQADIISVRTRYYTIIIFNQPN